MPFLRNNGQAFTGLISAEPFQLDTTEAIVVVVRDIESWKKKSKGKQPAVRYLEKPAPETVLVLVQGNDDEADADLASHCTIIECKPLLGDALDAWLDLRLEQREAREPRVARAQVVDRDTKTLLPKVADAPANIADLVE